MRCTEPAPGINTELQQELAGQELAKVRQEYEEKLERLKNIFLVSSRTRSIDIEAVPFKEKVNKPIFV